MLLEDYFDFNTQPVEHIRIKGTRISIDHVIELYKQKLTPEQIAIHFGSPITVEQAYATITYYLHNRDDIEAYFARGETIHQENLRKYREQPPSDAVKRIRAIKVAQAEVESKDNT